MSGIRSLSRNGPDWSSADGPATRPPRRPQGGPRTSAPTTGRSAEPRTLRLDTTPKGQDAAADHARVEEWLRGYVGAPHPDLGRNGPVCPFVPPALNAGAAQFIPLRRGRREPAAAHRRAGGRDGGLRGGGRSPAAVPRSGAGRPAAHPNALMPKPRPMKDQNTRGPARTAMANGSELAQLTVQTG
ncbi:DUF6875 domain-containing protein [Streptomyces griseoluteus]|uniref:DUF6875 domain-containing protein n=1 Tax=Streptomyces griseoluteus TaxID=29306 RepID=UPI003134377F